MVDSVVSVSPEPTDEEAAAIVAAIELAWPRPVVFAVSSIKPEAAGAWRWSGRWWQNHARSTRF